jgi:hypothetical protein
MRNCVGQRGCQTPRGESSPTAEVTSSYRNGRDLAHESFHGFAGRGRSASINNHEADGPARTPAIRDSVSALKGRGAWQQITPVSWASNRDTIHPRWTDRRLAQVVCELGDDDALDCLHRRLATERGWREPNCAPGSTRYARCQPEATGLVAPGLPVFERLVVLPKYYKHGPEIKDALQNSAFS